MKSLYQQEKELFARHADVADGKYISVEQVATLLGKDAVKYAINAVKGHYNAANFYNVFEMSTVLTYDGFSYAFTYYRMMEVKEGKYNEYQTPDYLARPEFGLNIKEKR